MKKSLVIVSIIIVALVVAGCAKKRMLDVQAPSQADTVQTGTAEGSTTATPTAGTDLKIAADQKAMREGKKVGGAHSGTVVLLPESMIQVDSNGNLLDGKVLVAMNYITVSDVTDSGMNAKLVDHLKAVDFFDVANHPTAVVDATKVEGNNVTADVTIRGVTKSLTFPVTLTKDGDGYTLSADLNLVRKDFGIGDTLLGKVALEDTFLIKLDKIVFMK